MTSRLPNPTPILTQTLTAALDKPTMLIFWRDRQHYVVFAFFAFKIFIECLAFFLQILLHFSLKKNLILHHFWTPFHNIFSIQQICEIIKLKKEQRKSVLEYDRNIICRRHPGYWKTKIAHFTKKNPYSTLWFLGI